MKLIVEFKTNLLAKLRRAPLAVRKYIDRVAFGPGAQKIARSAKANAPQAETGLVNAIRAKKRSLNVWEIVAGKNYASAVEEGTGPGGLVPIQTLIDWIKVKQIQPRDETMDQEELAFVIQNSIAAVGTPAQPFMQPSLDSNLPSIVDRIQKAYAAGMQLSILGRLN